MPNSATRLITLILLLQRKPNQKATGLAAELGVSVRTLHRYLGMLDEMGIPIYSERGPHGGFSLVRGYKMPPLVLTPDEAVAVSLGTSLVSEIWGELYRSAARGALAKLDNVLPDEQRSEIAWARHALVATGFLRADLSRLGVNLAKLRQVVRDRRTLRILYRSRQNLDPEWRQVDPYVLVFRWGWWYLVGFCHRRQAVRTFRVDRVLDLELSDDRSGNRFELPSGFDIHAYLQTEWAEKSQLEVRLRFDPEFAFLAQEGGLNWETTQACPDGAVEVTYKAPDLIWAASMAMGFGPTFSVLSPPELGALIKEWATHISKRVS